MIPKNGIDNILVKTCNLNFTYKYCKLSAFFGVLIDYFTHD